MTKEALQAELKTKTARIDELQAQLENAENPQEIMEELGKVSAEAEELTKSITIMDRIERVKAGTVTTTEAKPAVIHEEKHAEPTADDVMDFMVKSALVTFESKATGISVNDAIQKRYGKEAFVKAAQMFQKAATPQNPAMTTVDDWAGALTQQAFAAFLDLIEPDSVVGQLNLNRYSFDGYHSIKVPRRDNRFPTDKNLAGSFVGEGGAIRVGATKLSSLTLTPKKLAVIGTFTAEIFEQSTPNIEAMIRKWMLSDTAIMLDTEFLSDTAGTAIRPAGILHGVTPIAASGATVDKVDADLAKAITQLETAQGGVVRPQWIISKAKVRELSLLRVATGDKAYPELANGMLMGIPVTSSVSVPADKIILIDADSIGMAGGAPQFLASQTATIHEEYDAASVKPIVDGQGAAAQPVRSLYQTDSYALRMIMPIDWAVLRDGAVQVIA